METIIAFLFIISVIFSFIGTVLEIFMSWDDDYDGILDIKYTYSKRTPTGKVLQTIWFLISLPLQLGRLFGVFILYIAEWVKRISTK